MSTDEVLIVERRGPVDWVTLNRPDRLNALNFALVDAVRSYFEDLRRNRDTRIVVLRGAGRAFCAGFDMAPDSDVAQSIAQNRSPNAIWEIQNRFSDICRAMRRCPQPIIALMHGAACGGGFSLSLASDIRIAAETAKMNAAYIKIGLTGCDMGSSYFLPRLVGASMAAEIILTGRFVSAEEALAMRLVSRVVPEAGLDAAAQPLIDHMLATAPLGLRMSKEALNLSIDAPSLDAVMAVEDRHQALLSHSEDAREAIDAFLEKRAPVYQDR
ncbi:enoyl-CoA hydratase/isomerase family protein [Marinibaculum pumilum]|uniref:Enoyl-CoA hydratase/isomerase family protein n=1 Tax=Marinibaculum pumilum TaxID=1766165 RepID=A0ABV7KUH7_9PROT